MWSYLNINAFELNTRSMYEKRWTEWTGGSADTACAGGGDIGGNDGGRGVGANIVVQHSSEQPDSDGRVYKRNVNGSRIKYRWKFDCDVCMVYEFN
jgi:hypothetical protein